MYIVTHGQNTNNTGHSHLQAHDRRHNTDAVYGMDEDQTHTIHEDQAHQATFPDSAAAPHNAKYRRHQRIKAKYRIKHYAKILEQRKQTFHNNSNHDNNQLDEGDLI